MSVAVDGRVVSVIESRAKTDSMSCNNHTHVCRQRNDTDLDVQVFLQAE